jgi:hypothetical protein
VTYDFMRIEDTLASQGNHIFLETPVPNGTYAPGFYLSDQYITPLSLADYVISTEVNTARENLTPDNKLFFLYKK